MDIRVKMVLVPLPLLIAGYIGSSYLLPLTDELKTKDESIETQRQDKESKEAQLAKAATFSKRKQELSDEIEKLRGSVPKAPDIDLLTIDLERMCKDAGMNMVAVTSPKDQPVKIETTAQKQGALKSALKSGVQAAGAASQGGGMNAGASTSAGTSKPGEEAAPAGPELERTSKQFIVTGDYNGLEKLVNLLETYQRVVKIDDISFRVPRRGGKDKVQIEDSAPSDGEPAGDPRLLYVTMTLTTYYPP